MTLRGRDLIAAAVARSQSSASEPDPISLHQVRWATGAGAPAFGQRPLPERHRPGFAIKNERQGASHGREGMYGPRFGAAVLTADDVQALLTLMQMALASVPPPPGADLVTSARPPDAAPPASLQRLFTPEHLSTVRSAIPISATLTRNL